MPTEPRFRTLDTTQFQDQQVPAWDSERGEFLASTPKGYAPLSSPAFVDVPTAPTPALGTNTNQLATMRAIKEAIDALIAGAPGALDTLNEIALRLADDQDAVAALVAALTAEINDRVAGDNALQLSKAADTAFIGSGATSRRGLVPDPGASPGNARFLREDGSFAEPVAVPAWSMEWRANLGNNVPFDPAIFEPEFSMPVFAANGDLVLGVPFGVHGPWVPIAGNTLARFRSELLVKGAAKTIQIEVFADNAARLYFTPAGGARVQLTPDVVLGVTDSAVFALNLTTGWNLLEIAYSNDGGNEWLTVQGQGGRLVALVDSIRAPLARVASANATQLQGIPVAATAPAPGQVLAFSNGSYVPTTPAAGGGGSGGADFNFNWLYGGF